jgi:adenylyltransferase/sulfurtransferase
VSLSYEPTSSAALKQLSSLEKPLSPLKPLPDLDKKEIARYGKHLLLPEVGLDGQKRLKNARVLIVGAGGLGAPCALYLAAAGVGIIGIVDSDEVELSNLQRQIIHREADIKRAKALSAGERMKSLNSLIEIKTHITRLDSTNAAEILGQYDLVIDGSDNFPTRYLLNDAAAFLDLPLVYGSVHQFEGQASVFWASKGPCYRCLYPTPPGPGVAPSCGETGVLGVLPGLIGCVEAAEAIKLIVGGAKSLVGRLLILDAWLMEFTDMELEKDPDCPLCGPKRTIFSFIDYEQFCDLDEPPELRAPGLTPLELQKRLKEGPPIKIIDIREPYERDLIKFFGALESAFVDLISHRSQLDPKVEAIVVCKVGRKSLFAIRALKKAGYEGNLLNLKGGTQAWAKEFNLEE